MTIRDINHRLHDQPFKPFRIDLSDGSAIPVMNARLVLVSETSAILATEVGHDSDGYLGQ